jgi:HSP20 family protein
MHELIIWKKEELDKLRRDMDRLFTQFRRTFGVPRSLIESAGQFGVELSETEKLIIVNARLPGMKPEEIDISVTDDLLTLKGTQVEDSVENGEGFQRTLQSSQSFQRTFRMPCRIVPDEVKASLKDGVLRIELPKCSPQVVRGIKVKVD